jgi:hypothetical protein
MVTEERTQSMLDLVRVDYERTSEFTRGVLGTAATIRGWAVTTWLALSGFAVQQDDSILALLGIAVIVSFYVADAYHMGLYRQGLRHLAQLERLFGEYYGALSRANDDDEAMDDFLIDLEAHRFGFYRQLEPFSLGRSLDARPRVFVFLYAALLVTSIGLAILTA